MERNDDWLVGGEERVEGVPVEGVRVGSGLAEDHLKDQEKSVGSSSMGRETGRENERDR